MVAIESAYWGDEKQSRNITTRILEMVSGGKLDITANERLIPAVETSATTTIKLSQGEETQIRKDAVAQCGPSDQTCIEFNVDRLRKNKLRDKEVSTQSAANVIKGRRLTLIINRDGERKKIEVPDGNKYTLDGIVGTIKSGSDINLPSKENLTQRVISYMSTIIGVTIYVLGILIPYVVLVLDGLQMWAYAIGVLCAIVPPLGYFVFLAYIVVKKINSPNSQ